jgi:chemotaxis protein methyltransferase CheR
MSPLFPKPRDSRAPVSENAELTTREFTQFRDLIHEETGIFLADSKKMLLHGRLARRVRELGLRCFGDYFEVVKKPEQHAEFVRMIDLVTTNETQFFREPHHFDYLEQKAFPEWLAAAAAGDRDKRIRVWSAGCSSGEEPHSMAMVLLWHFPRQQGWSVDILASDLSTRVLDTARSATWSIDKARHIPERFLKRFMLKGVGGHDGDLRAGREIRDVIRFERTNLADGPRPDSGPFDIILCRNVLIYFDVQRRASVAENLISQLKQVGLFLVGHAESVRSEGRLVCVYPTIYRTPFLRASRSLRPSEDDGCTWRKP